MYYIYILTNKSNSVLYIGMTGDLRRRVYEHNIGIIDGFSKKYNTKKLVYFEEYQSPQRAIAREKQLKKWTRKKKDLLIETTNPEWLDHSERFI